MICPWIVAAALLVGSPQAPGGDPAGGAAALAEYHAQRARIPDTADAHWKLGLWAEQEGLKGESIAEFLDVARLDPNRDAVRKKLGFVKHQGRWATVQELAAEKAEAEARRKGDARWRPLLARWKVMLGQKAKRAEAESALAAVTDPRAVPSIWSVFGLGTPGDQERAIDMLGHIESEPSSKALAGLAVLGKSDLVRRAAVETLIRREADDVLMAWIGLLQKPVKYQVRQVAGPGSPGELLIEGQKINVRRYYSPPSMGAVQDMFVDNTAIPRLHWPLQFDSNPSGPPGGSRYVGQNRGTMLYVFDYTWGPPKIDHTRTDPSKPYQSFEKSQLQAQVDRDFELTETAKMADGAQGQLQQDVNLIEAGNAATRDLNARLSEALRRVSGKDFGDDREAWLRWYMERRGYKYVATPERTKPTVEMQVPLPYVPQSGPPLLSSGGGGGGGKSDAWCMIWERDGPKQRPKTGSCFAAGTPIRTPDGLRAIESLRLGDRVIAVDGPGQSARAVAIESIHRSRALGTMRLVVDGESIVATDGHPLWKVDAGWTRAGDLTPGDLVAARDRPARVEAVGPSGAGEVWNLRLADGSAYQVGRVGMLAHDLGPIPEVIASGR